MATGNLDLGDATLFYEIIENENRVRITGLRGTPFRVEVPQYIEDMPVTEIAKKAFLSCRGLREVVIPDGVLELGEWAFAYSKHLEMVSLPARELVFGKDLFLGCDSLTQIVFRDHMEKQYGESVPFLTAKAVIVLDSLFLCNPKEAGETEWFQLLDDRILQFLEKDDMEGYAELWTCGEEDYEGKDYDPYSYPSEKRKEKVRMLFFRLIYADGLRQETKEIFYEYLRKHTAGCEEEETWQVLADEFGSRHEYYEIFAEAGCLTDDNFDMIMDRLRELGEKDVTKNYPEMKGYFIRFRQDTKPDAREAFFDQFCL